MRHQKKKFILDRDRGGRRALIRSLGISLITHGTITTTRARARAVAQTIEPLIAKGRRGDVASLRHCEKILGNKAAVRDLTRRAAAMKSLNGGFTRIIKVQPRKGDGAPQVRIEFVHYE